MEDEGIDDAVHDAMEPAERWHTRDGAALTIRPSARGDFAIRAALHRRAVHRHRAALLARRIDSARLAGIERLSDVTFIDNTGMLQLARTFGFRSSREARDAMLARMTLRL